MERKPLVEKLKREARLTAQEEALLDDLLERETHALAAVVAATRDEQPSLSWRSQLNEKLQAARPPRGIRSPWILRLGPVAGVAAAALGFWLLQAGPPISESQPTLTDQGPSLESQLLSAHRDVTTAIEVSSVTDVSSPARSERSGLIEWSEADLGAL